MFLPRLVLALSLLLALPAHAAEVTVYAAASMKTALDQVIAQWQAESGDRVHVSYAGSGALARQIVAGAPADIFISANPGWMDKVAETGNVKAREDLLGNSLVLIAHDPQAEPVTLGPQTDFPALLKGGKLAMAFVDSVPAGQYGKAALTSFGLWDQVAPDVAQVDNVRATLYLVALGAAPYGITYATDAVAEARVHVVGTFPADSHPPIIYPVARLNDSEAARQFYDDLSRPETSKIFHLQGFTILK